jgi:DNA (cytosine-5)-methyltransferase 1
MSGFIRDDFAAGGGWSEGLRMLGLSEHEVGVELMADPCATARAAGHKRWQADVTSVAVREYAWPTLWGYIGSPECQTFSTAGKGEGAAHMAAYLQALRLVARGKTPEAAVAAVSDAALNKSAMLSLEPMYVIWHHGPRWIALEQTPKVLPLWQAYAEILATWGYSVWTGILNAEQYGVPQTRRRAVLMASLDRAVAPPTPTHSRYYSHDRAKLDPGVLKWVSMAEALGDAYAELEMRSNYGTGGDPKARGVRPAPAPAPTITSKADRNLWIPTAAVPGDTSWAYERPSPTIVGSFAPDVVAAPGYRKAGDGPRQTQPGSIRVTAQEAAILQSFRPDYPWHGSKSSQFTQIGNAVPPLLARAVLAELVA